MTGWTPEIMAKLARTLNYLDTWLQETERADGALRTNKLRDEMIERIRNRLPTYSQRRYLATIASPTAREDVLGGKPDRFWHMLRDPLAKRMPLLDMRPGENAPLSDIIVFARVGVTNLRLLTGLRQAAIPQEEWLPQGPSGFRGLGHFLDVMDYHILPDLAEILARRTGLSDSAMEETIAGRIDMLQRRVHEGMVDDLAGLDIIGPIDPVRFQWVKPRPAPAPAPVA